MTWNVARRRAPLIGAAHRSLAFDAHALGPKRTRAHASLGVLGFKGFLLKSFGGKTMQTLRPQCRPPLDRHTVPILRLKRDNLLLKFP